VPSEGSSAQRYRWQLPRIGSDWENAISQVGVNCTRDRRSAAGNGFLHCDGARHDALPPVTLCAELICREGTTTPQ